MRRWGVAACKRNHLSLDFGGPTLRPIPVMRPSVVLLDFCFARIFGYSWAPEPKFTICPFDPPNGLSILQKHYVYQIGEKCQKDKFSYMYWGVGGGGSQEGLGGFLRGGG